MFKRKTEVEKRLYKKSYNEGQREKEQMIKDP